jgi:hypothetical protein
VRTTAWSNDPEFVVVGPSYGRVLRWFRGIIYRDA